jgi:hypothetical protein
MKSLNFASVLLIAAALGLWVSQHAVSGERVASVLDYSVAKTAAR